MVNTNNPQFGLFAGITCFTLWGLLPLYFKLMGHIIPLEMLAHRVIWSLPTGIVFVILARGYRDILSAMTWRRIGWLCLSSMLIAANWLTYIWSVNNGKVMEASLGYYINPIITVILGAVFFKERLNLTQKIAVALASTGVVIMGVAIGSLPWAALTLCMTFAVYSIIRKQIAVDSRVGFVIESGLLFLPALAWLIWQVDSGTLGFFGNGSSKDVFWLMMAGPITAIPLILFSFAARSIKLSTIGMIQYIGPTIQFLLAIWIFNETFDPLRATAFGFIWTALLIYSAQSFMFKTKTA